VGRAASIAWIPGASDSSWRDATDAVRVVRWDEEGKGMHGFVLPRTGTGSWFLVRGKARFVWGDTNASHP